jgi:hypothetical protein
MFVWFVDWSKARQRGEAIADMLGIRLSAAMRWKSFYGEPQGGRFTALASHIARASLRPRRLAINSTRLLTWSVVAWNRLPP